MNRILEKVYKVCKETKKQLQCPVTFRLILTKIRKQFRLSGIDLSIRSRREKSLGMEEFYIDAYYDPDDDRNLSTPIEVNVIHNFDSKNLWDQNQIYELLIQLYDAVVHELVHQEQSRNRNYKSTDIDGPEEDFIKYLKDPDEIDAYSISIAIELIRNLGRYRAMRFLPKFSSLGKFKIKDQYVSPNLSMYVNHFGKTDSPTIKKLSKKVYKRLEKIDTEQIFL